MTFKALRRPHQLGRAGIQVTDARRSRRHLHDSCPSTAGRLTGRWIQGPDGCLSLKWTVVQEHANQSIANEEAMPDSDEARSHRSGALARPAVML
jgi:hypothetical protein